jgi:carbamoyl-phosphate synthase large subunit
VHQKADLERYMEYAVRVSNDSPVLIDRYLSDAIEVDVDCVADGKEVWIGGVMEHVEQAGVHSGDSACCLPPHSLSPALVDELRRETVLMAKALDVRGLMNVQFAVKRDGEGEAVYVLEVNPRASRTVPFVSKATGVPLAKIAARCMAGTSLAEQGVREEVIPPYYSVKEAVFPFAKFPGVDTILGPEMKSTGEVMGVGDNFGEAFVKSQLASSSELPKPGGRAFVSVRSGARSAVIELAQALRDLGFNLVATRGTAQAIESAGITVAVVNKVKEGRPHIVDMIKNGDIDFIVNVVDDKKAVKDSYAIRAEALARRVVYFTTLAGARAACMGMRHGNELTVYSLQSLHQRLH